LEGHVYTSPQQNPFLMRERFIFAFFVASYLHLYGGEAYFTGFEDFVVGEDKVIGTDSWLGSYARNRLHGVMSEAQHGVAGIGNAAFVGGFATTITKTTSSNSVFVRRPVNLDPLALNQEVATFSVVFGIKDSTVARRDNFEFLIYNQSNALLGGLQFDNSTLDSFTGKPRRLIYRLSWNASTSSLQYVLTSYNFLPETLENLEFRINYRTNRWTASLSDVPIFQDILFYTGTATKNFGYVIAKMAVASTTSTSILPGDNYLLFDDYSVRTDALSMALDVSRTTSGAAKLVWNEEAGYSYRVEYSSDCATWKTDLAGSSHTATLTQSATFIDPTPTIPQRRFYRIKRTYP
jgi:hypothetical protein